MSKPLKRGERWAIVGDTQCPFHDPAAVELAAQVIETFDPDHLIFNGDMIDFWSISKHNPRRAELHQKISLQDEIDVTISVQDILARGLSKKARKYMIDGNHEDRLERYLGTGAQSIVGSLKGLQMPVIFDYEKRGFEKYVPYGEGIWITDNLFVYHGEYVGSTPGDSVKKEIIARGASVIMNHVHRRADLLFRQGKSIHRGIENGCLCQLASGYKAQTNWTQCLTLIEVEDDKHWRHEIVDIIRDEGCGMVYCIYKDRKYFVPLDYDDGMSLPWRADKIINFKGDE